jgi:hypothetical protein
MGVISVKKHKENDKTKALKAVKNNSLVFLRYRIANSIRGEDDIPIVIKIIFSANALFMGKSNNEKTTVSIIESVFNFVIRFQLLDIPIISNAMPWPEIKEKEGLFIEI